MLFQSSEIELSVNTNLILKWNYSFPLCFCFEYMQYALVFSLFNSAHVNALNSLTLYTGYLSETEKSLQLI